MKVFVVANDVVPEMGGPVAAPGIRASGLAIGLRSHGFDVTVGVVGSATGGSGDEAIPPERLVAVLEAERPEAVVVSNDLYLDRVPESIPLIFDVFAARDQELAARSDPAPPISRVAEIRHRMAAGIERARIVISNGPAKLGYIEGLVPGAADRTVVVPLAVPPLEAQVDAVGPTIVGMAGYLQRWSRFGPGLDVLQGAIGPRLRVEIVTGTHWGSEVDVSPSPAHQQLVRYEEVDVFAPMPFVDLRFRMSKWHALFDLFEETPERRLAMVSRTVVAIAGGIPVIHPPYSEVSPFVEEYGAGWIVDPFDEVSVRAALEQVQIPHLRAAKAGGARALGDAVFAPGSATRPLAEELWRW